MTGFDESGLDIDSFKHKVTITRCEEETNIDGEDVIRFLTTGDSGTQLKALRILEELYEYHPRRAKNAFPGMSYMLQSPSKDVVTETLKFLLLVAERHQGCVMPLSNAVFNVYINSEDYQQQRLAVSILTECNNCDAEMTRGLTQDALVSINDGAYDEDLLTTFLHLLMKEARGMQSELQDSIYLLEPVFDADEATHADIITAINIIRVVVSDSKELLGEYVNKLQPLAESDDDIITGHVLRVAAEYAKVVGRRDELLETYAEIALDATQSNIDMTTESAVRFLKLVTDRYTSIVRDRADVVGELLKHDDSEVQINACIVLGKAHAVEVKSELEALVERDDVDGSVKTVAEKAIAAIDQEKKLPQ